MRDRARGRVLHEAHALALRLRLGDAVLPDLAQLRRLAEAALPPEAGLRRVIEGLAVHVPLVRRDAEALRAAGARLRDAVEMALRPEPVGLTRRDING